ncbi:MAG: hypothetical protein ACJ75J_01765 [Cytophagaceae bacterium]
MNFIGEYIQKKTGLFRKVNLSSLTTAEKAKYILKNGKFVEKRTSYGQTLDLYLLEQVYYEILYETHTKTVLKVMEISESAMARFYGGSKQS